MDTSELAARESIRDTLHAYAWAADTGDHAGLVSLFTEDGVLAVAGHEFTGRNGIKVLLESTSKRLKDADEGADVPEDGTAADDAAAESPGADRPHRIRHHVTNIVFDELGEDQARTRCTFLALTAAGADHWGEYHDRLVREDDGVWRFVRREARVVNRAPNGIFR